MTRTAAAYVLPIRRQDSATDDELDELATYLRRVGERCSVIVVDGSSPVLFARAHQALAGFCVHVAPAPDIPGVNGKARGVLSGARLARHDRIVLADDDVRYDMASLDRVIAALDDAEIVRPQNVFASFPWHARWDTARTLLNRAVGADFPGTLAVGRQALEACGGYDADVLFENLELIRTIVRAGGRERHLPDCYVARLAPTATHFWSQRVRQAYDEFARPARLALFLSLVPTSLVIMVHASPRRARRLLLSAVALVTAIAEAGRRRAGGASVFPGSTVLFAPVWLLERACCSWLAVGARLRGGCRYGDERLRWAATPRRSRTPSSSALSSAPIRMARLLSHSHTSATMMPVSAP